MFLKLASLFLSCTQAGTCPEVSMNDGDMERVEGEQGT